MDRRFLSRGAFGAVLGVATVASADVTIGWANLQWPPALNEVVGTPSANVYGQVWAVGVTDQPGQGAGILAQLGYGPLGEHPTLPSWLWVSMAYNVDVGNNDEYVGTITPSQVGTFHYTTRFSGDGGANWIYTDLNGPPYESVNAGVMTVTPEPGSLALLAGAAMALGRRRR